MMKVQCCVPESVISGAADDCLTHLSGLTVALQSTTKKKETEGSDSHFGINNKRLLPKCHSNELNEMSFTTCGEHDNTPVMQHMVASARGNDLMLSFTSVGMKTKQSR